MASPLTTVGYLPRCCAVVGYRVTARFPCRSQRPEYLHGLRRLGTLRVVGIGVRGTAQVTETIERPGQNVTSLRTRTPPRCCASRPARRSRRRSEPAIPACARLRGTFSCVSESRRIFSSRVLWRQLKSVAKTTSTGRTRPQSAPARDGGTEA